MRAYSFRAAINSGLEPREYSDEAPVGTFNAHLDFKIWGKLPALRCFFTDEEGQKFSLYAGKPKTNPNWYSPRDGGLDMSDHDAAGKWYEVTTAINSKGKIAWLSAVELPSPHQPAIISLCADRVIY